MLVSDQMKTQSVLEDLHVHCTFICTFTCISDKCIHPFFLIRMSKFHEAGKEIEIATSKITTMFLNFKQI